MVRFPLIWQGCHEGKNDHFQSEVLNCFMLIAWISSGQGKQPGEAFKYSWKGLGVQSHLLWHGCFVKISWAAWATHPTRGFFFFFVKHSKRAQELKPRRAFSLQSKICLLCLVWTDGNCVITSWSASCCRSFCLCSILIFSAGCIKVWSQQKKHRW